MLEKTSSAIKQLLCHNKMVADFQHNKRNMKTPEETICSRIIQHMC